MKERVYIGWEDFGVMIDTLAERIKNSKTKFDGVFGIPRGGLVLAVCLSHKLNLKMLYRPTKKTLICDDISDTGKTLYKYRKSKIACLYTTPYTKTKPTWSKAVKAARSIWVVFPWEI